MVPFAVACSGIDCPMKAPRKGMVILKVWVMSMRIYLPAYTFDGAIDSQD